MMVQVHQMIHLPVVNTINLYLEAVAIVWPPFWFIVFILLGGIFGSFLTAMLYRVPRGLDISQPPSSCPHCNTVLGVKDLVPVFSYVFSCGKCNYCGKIIKINYVLIELLCVFLGFLAVYAAQGIEMFVLFAALIALAFVVLAAVLEKHFAPKVLLFSIIMWLILLF